MGNLKKLDIEGMLGRVNHIKLGDEYWNDFFAADNDLVEIDRLISECGIEGISSVGYISQADKIGMLQHDCDLLKEYPKNLVEELIPVDTEFAHNVNNALNALSAIRVDDIKIKNTFNVTITQHFDDEAYYWASESKDLKKNLTLADFVGYFDDYLMGRETSFVKGFTDVLYSKETLDRKDLQTVLKEKNSDLRVLLYGSEFDMKKYQPNAVQWSNLENAATCGLYSIEIAILGYDTITKERLTEEERAIRGLTGVVGLIPLLMGWGQAGSSLEGSVQYLSMAGGNVAQTSTEYACDELGVPPLISALISTAAGMGVGVVTYNVGTGYVKQQNTGKGIFEGFDKDTTFASEMDPEEAARYGQWWEDTNSGLNNHHPGMSDEDLNLWRIADERLGDEMALARVDGDAVIELRQRWQVENAYNSVGNGVFEGRSGSIEYGELDSLGRTTRAEAVITPDMIETGSPAKSSIKPAGFGGQAQGHARGHLIGNQLGGSGSDPRNLMTIYQNPTNHPIMSSIEANVRKVVEGGQIVYYKVTPIYNGNNLIPRGITIQATGESDFYIYQTILNGK